MTDYEREERAFAAAFGAHAGEVPGEALRTATPGRRWVPAALVAALVLAVLGTTSLLLGNQETKASGPVAEQSYWEQHEGRWISFRNVEVLAPATWRDDYEASRPDCIQDPVPGQAAVPNDAPRAPYVALGVPDRVVATVGCFREPKAGDPDPRFGELPFRIWQPYVKAEAARPDLGQPRYEDAVLEYRGWHLTRTTKAGIQITVLSAPGDDGLGAAVMASLRTVSTTTLGCEVDSPVVRDGFPAPTGAALPAADSVSAFTICQYVRGYGRDGFEASRQVTGAAARDLVGSVQRAPRGGGPDQPETCLHDTSRDRVLVLRVFTTESRGTVAGEAYAYTDSCFGNGIVEAGRKYQLTRENCLPLFAKPPIGFWGGNGRVAERCLRD